MYIQEYIRNEFIYLIASVLVTFRFGQEWKGVSTIPR